MNVSLLARLFGVVYLLVGIAGFVPALSSPTPADAPPLLAPVMAFYSSLLHYFPTNVVENIVHVLLGLWALVAGASVAGARTFFRSAFWILLVLGILGLFSATKTLFGLAPLYGYDVWLHFALAVISGLIGYLMPSGSRARA
jgi:uncharacterized protein DUF4383